MTPNLTLVIVSSVLIGTGVYLFLARSLVRALLGFLLMGNGINLLFIIASGPAGSPPIVGMFDDPMADPVPQALVLTAIVITLAMTAFVLALAHRSWQLGRQDIVDDDTESARIHARAEADDLGDDNRSAREQAAEIEAESQRAEREMSKQGRGGGDGSGTATDAAAEDAPLKDTDEGTDADPTDAELTDAEPTSTDPTDNEPTSTDPTDKQDGGSTR
ncbi:Na(+)/H(+) antiporter subunit C [Ornithinimicrobium sp. Y1694]|uniref:Na(+)/H(+) antiporter subunit C n=1 Tax=Ornithinimicrobium sp. Y1694 TaxID=3418590 RepID=UPI003CEAB8C1